MSEIKNLVKKGLSLLPFSITKNMRYDKETWLIMKKVLKADSNCVDIGCHKGEVLELMLKLAPKGKHIGFEPIPHFYQLLEANFPSNCSFYNLALSNQKGVITFNFVKSNPAYSGIKKRQYARANEEIEIINVATDLLDNILENKKIDFIKIDVEGAEGLVLKGAVNTLTKQKPIIVFEHGMGAADHYETTPKDVFDILNSCGLKVNTLSGWLQNKKELDLQSFEKQYYKQINYYFISYP